MLHTIQSSTLPVPGAELYYEVQGRGPILLIIPGGPQDAGVFADLARCLAERYTVVAFDPRGNSRSAVDGPPEDLSVDVQADDAAALLGALGGGPAFVFGTSGGAQIGLNLAARYPDLVRALVAHEPPTILLLDDPSQALAADQEIYDTYRRAGVDAAMHRFFADNGLAEGAPPADAPPTFDLPAEAAATFARVSANFEYWLAHGMLPLSLYRPAVETLRQGQPRVVVGVGERSAGLPIASMGMALAAQLGSQPVAFPGDHMGFETFAEPFAASLHQALAGH